VLAGTGARLGCRTDARPHGFRAKQAETDRYWNAIVGNGGQQSDRDNLFEREAYDRPK